MLQDVDWWTFINVILSFNKGHFEHLLHCLWNNPQVSLQCIFSSVVWVTNHLLVVSHWDCGLWSDASYHLDESKVVVVVDGVLYFLPWTLMQQFQILAGFDWSTTPSKCMLHTVHHKWRGRYYHPCPSVFPNLLFYS